MFGRTEPNPNKKGRTTEPNRTDHFISELLEIFCRRDQASMFCTQNRQHLVVSLVLIIFCLLASDKILIFLEFFFKKILKILPNLGHFSIKCSVVFGSVFWRCSAEPPNITEQPIFGRTPKPNKCSVVHYTLLHIQYI